MLNVITLSVAMLSVVAPMVNFSGTVRCLNCRMLQRGDAE
jgi:hypothetical protein